MPRTAAKVAVNAVQLSRAARSPESSSRRKTVAMAAGTAGRESLILVHYPVPAAYFQALRYPTPRRCSARDTRLTCAAGQGLEPVSAGGRSSRLGHLLLLRLSGG